MDGKRKRDDSVWRPADGAAEDSRFRDILAGNNSRWEKAEKQDVTKRERE